MSVKLLTEQHLEFLSLTGGCTGSSESNHVKMPHCWKSHVAARVMIFFQYVCNQRLLQNFGIALICKMCTYQTCIK